jgi:hypothetical protein
MTRLISPKRESIALMKKCIYYSAPVTHKAVPKRTTGEAIQAAFDEDDNPVKPPKQSVSEQQTDNQILPMHGLRMWQGLLKWVVKLCSYISICGLTCILVSS